MDEQNVVSRIELYRTIVARWDALKADLMGTSPNGLGSWADYPARTDNARPSKPRRAKRGGKRNRRGDVRARVLDIDGDFDTSRAASLTGISTKYAAVLLSTLTRRRLLQRVRRGVYRVGKGK